VQVIDYYEQVLKPVVAPAFQGLLDYTGHTENFIEGNDWGLYVKDHSPVHRTKKKLVEANQMLAILLHARLTSSPDLNPIENVWRIMKQRIKARPHFPCILEEMKVAVQ
jgi:hypothetical protein